MARRSPGTRNGFYAWAGGTMSPDPDRTGHGLALRDADAERYRRG